MLTMAKSRSGHEIASINGVLLHSSYNPKNEAARFVAGAFQHKTPGKIVLLGAELGYLAEALKERFPRTPLVCVYYSTQVFRQSFLQGDSNWHPEMAVKIDDFFYDNLSELDVEGLEYIEWSPSSLLFKEAARSVNSALTQVLRELSGSLITAIGSGRLWLKNTIFNFLSFATPLGGNPCPDALPTVILASGPTLEQSLPLLKKYQHKLRLWALPSALSLCRENGLLPDLVILTDPGYYSACHVQASGLRDLTVAMPFSACRGLWRVTSNIFPLLQPNFFEQALWKKTKINLPLVPLNGTVAGSALELAWHFSRGPIIIAGLDFCYRDIFSHARPNAFDDLISFASGRFSPYLSGLYQRALTAAPVKITGKAVRTSQAYHTYSGWFDALPAERKSRVYRLQASPLSLAGIKNLDQEGFNSMVATIHAEKCTGWAQPLPQYPAYRERKEMVLALIDQWSAELANREFTFCPGRTTRAPGPEQRLLELTYFLNPRLLLEYKRAWRCRNLTEIARLEKLIPVENGILLSRLKDKILV